MKDTMLTITNSKDELAVAIKELKTLENQTKMFESRMKQLKDFIKASDYQEIHLKNDNDDILVSIKKYSSSRDSWNAEYLNSILNVEQMSKAKTSKIIESVRITIK